MFIIKFQWSTHMVIIPHLIQHRKPAISRVLPCGRSVEPRSCAAQEWDSTMLLGQHIPNIRITVRCRVVRYNVCVGEPVKCWQLPVVLYRRLEEIHYFLVLAVGWAVAGHIESGETGRVLAELMGMEARVILLPGYPVRVHVLEEVVAAKGFEEAVDGRACVGWHNGPVGQAVGRVRGWDRIVLSRQVAVLRVASVAKIRPQTVCGPMRLRLKLPLGFKAGVCIPELGAQDQAAKSLNAARVDL